MKKIVCTGPESSGKSTLAIAIAQALAVHRVPEFARTWLEHLGRDYVHQDLYTIANGQRAWEAWHLNRSMADAKPMMVCDSDWTVIHIWEKYKYQSNLVCPKHRFPSADLYLLCKPDMPWVYDPLREHPLERDQLFMEYEQLLLDMGANYCVVRGGASPERVNMALEAIKGLV